MRRGVMIFVLAMLVFLTGATARGAAAEEMQLELPIASGLDTDQAPHGSVTVNVLKCNPGMTIVTLDPAGCTADNSGVEFAIWDIEYQQNYSQIQAIDNGNGSFTWGGLMVEETMDGQGDGDHVGFYALALVAASQGAINWAGFGDFDQNSGTTFIHTDYPAAWIDFYFFFPAEEHDPGDWIDNGDDDDGIDELAGVVSVNAYLCPADFIPANPNGWAATCVDLLDGPAFTLTHLDSPYVDTRVAGQDGGGNAFFAPLGKGTYELTVELYEGMLLGDGICDQANQSGVAGVYGLGVEPGVGTTCNYYIVPDPQIGKDEPVDQPEGEDEPEDDGDDASDDAELESVTSLPITGTGATATAPTGTNTSAVIVALLVTLTAGGGAAFRAVRA
ncbi:MAG: hypothetical protein ACRDJH_22905 [Thermomicrobiales bacterium]